MHLARHLTYWARERDAHPALIGPDTALTWGELGLAAGTFAGSLREYSATRGVAVGCLLPNRLEWCVAFAGIQLAEAICVPLNPLFGPDELRFIAGDAGCELVVSTRRLMARLSDDFVGQEDDSVGLFEFASQRWLGPVDLFPPGPLAAHERCDDDHDVAAICYTSGTTGRPKGAAHTHRSIAAMTSGLTGGYPMTLDEVFLLAAPLSFTGGVICNLAVSLSLGATLILEPVFDPARTLRLIARHRVTAFGGAAIFWQRLAETDGFAAADLSSLRNGFTGGSPVSPELIQLFHDKGVGIRQAYGCTEVCGGATLPTAAQAVLRPESCGRPMIGLDLEIHDDTGRRCVSGEVGEIVMRGPQLMTGYWGQPELTASAFRGDWYCSGDLGYLNAFGELVVVDRKKNMVISGGVNIYPAEVEAIICSLRGVREAIAFGIVSPAWGEELVAIVVSDEALSPSDMLATLKDRLGAYKAPKRLMISRELLPRTSTGKIERSAAAARLAFP